MSDETVTPRRRWDHVRQKGKILFAWVALIYHSVLVLCAIYLFGAFIGFTLLWYFDESPTEPVEPMPQSEGG